MTPRWDTRADENQAATLEALRAAGYKYDLSFRMGKGFPDVIVWTKTYPPLAAVIEIKMPGEKLNANEIEWWNQHEGALGGISRYPDEALTIMARADEIAEKWTGTEEMP